VAQEGNLLRALEQMVSGLRPERGEDPGARVRALAAHLEADPEAGETLGSILRRVTGEVHCFPALTSSGVPGGEGFVPELFGRLGRRILPPVTDPRELEDVLRIVFDDGHDHVWLREVPEADWRSLLDALGITAESVRGVDPELALAIRVLGHHAASMGLKPAILQRLPHLEDPESPFLLLGERVVRYLESHENEIEGDEDPLLDAALGAVADCRQEVERLREEKREHGTSLWLTGLTSELLEVLERLNLLLHMTEPTDRDFQGCTVRLLQDLVEAAKTRDHVIPHLRASADLLALEVVEAAARKGSKYITSGRSDYLRFLGSSMAGGLLVALFSLAKVIMSQWDVSLAAQAFLYGTNYALCFVLIYLTGATLATKQPAMTANTLARSLGEDGMDLSRLEDLIVRVWRSQFISFVGNVVVALPVAYLLSELFFRASGGLLAAPEKAQDMLAALHPLQSGTLFYAGVAGVLLFAAGLLSGWVDNWLRHRRVPARIAGHQGLLRLVGTRGASKVSRVLDAKLGALAGNVFLGFGLGSMGTLGEIFGLPLDIRHIAFASAETGTSLEILQGGVPTDLLVAAAASVLVIGLINFVVSFGLSLMVALESRGLGLGGGGRIARHLVRRFLRNPLEWFVPPSDGASSAGQTAVRE